MTDMRAVFYANVHLKANVCPKEKWHMRHSGAPVITFSLSTGDISFSTGQSGFHWSKTRFREPDFDDDHVKRPAYEDQVYDRVGSRISADSSWIYKGYARF